MEKTYNFELTAFEAAGVLACLLAVLHEEKTIDDADILGVSLKSAARKISTELKVPVILAG